MCKYVDNLFGGIGNANLNRTESNWVSKLGSAYNRNGHLSNRQLEVIRDINSRHSYRNNYYDDDYDW